MGQALEGAGELDEALHVLGAVRGRAHADRDVLADRLAVEAVVGRARRVAAVGRDDLQAPHGVPGEGQPGLDDGRLGAAVPLGVGQDAAHRDDAEQPQRNRLARRDGGVRAAGVGLLVGVAHDEAPGREDEDREMADDALGPDRGLVLDEEVDDRLVPEGRGHRVLDELGEEAALVDAVAQGLRKGGGARVHHAPIVPPRGPPGGDRRVRPARPRAPPPASPGSRRRAASRAGRSWPARPRGAR